MTELDSLDVLFVVWAFLLQIVLIVHFLLRKWAFQTAVKYGWILYALSVPAALVSLWLLLGGKPWWQWLGGFLYLAWAAYGYRVEYRQRIEWRSPLRWSVAGPYLFLYLATVMFYWWPLGRFSRALWFVQALLFIGSTILNLTSHTSGVDKPRTL
jgi:hypothetical protein